MSAAPPTVDLTDIPAADQLIGMGQLTQGQVLQELLQLPLDGQMARLAEIRQTLGADSDAYRRLRQFLVDNDL